MFDSESSSDGGWISWFCDLEGHEYFVEVITGSISTTFPTVLIYQLFTALTHHF